MPLIENLHKLETNRRIKDLSIIIFMTQNILRVGTEFYLLKKIAQKSYQNAKQLC